MPLIIPPGFVQASFVLTGLPGTQPYVTTLGLDTSAYGGDFEAAANRTFTVYADHILPITNNDLDLDRVTLFIGSDGPSGSIDSTASPESGSDAGAMAPTAMSLIARKSTADPGRRGRGRMFLPGTAAESEVDESGAVSPTQVSAVNGILNQFFDSFVDPPSPELPLIPVLFHSTAPADPTPLTGFTVAPLVGWVLLSWQTIFIYCWS